MQVNVTQEDINKGCGRSISNCPIALALGRKLKDKTNWFCVGTSWFSARINDENKDYKLPDAAVTFISEFDSGAKVEPFTFTVSLE